MDKANDRIQEFHIRLLGGFSVMAGETAIPEDAWRSKRARSLVKLLALAPGHRLTRDQAIDALWPDSDLAAAANNLHQTLYTARRILESIGPYWLVLDDGLLSLGDGKYGTLVIDVDQFEARAVQARKEHNPQAYREALELYNGELLPEDRYEEWTIQRREELEQTYQELLLRLARLYEERHEYQDGIEVAKRALAHDPAHEQAHTGLMRLYALSGQRQQALRQYQVLSEVLQKELGVEPGAPAQRLYAEIQSGRFPAGSSLGRPEEFPWRRTNLPAQLTTFIGRESQIAEVSRLVREHRLVTLTGSGGVGKTRLALQVAEGLVEDYVDGVFLVELASLSDPEMVPQACGQTLELIEKSGIAIQDLLAHYLEKKQLLLILDNCEHVIEACTRLVDHLLKTCPKLNILATSREILSVPGESPYRVPSLGIPRSLKLEELVAIESVRLFVERVSTISPGFSLSDANAGAVAQICRRLDGIPLAIELAAGRARMLAIEQIAARLDDTFRLLTGGSRSALPRQQTLKATIDWSYEQLAPKERWLLQRLSVFAGGWTIEAAEAVGIHGEMAGNGLAAQPGEVLDLLTQLVDKSLVNVESHEGQVRYSMLEIVRQYAHEQLVVADGAQAVRDRHLEYYAGLTAEAEPHLRGQGQVEWLTRLDQELPNLRLALDWSVEGDVVRGLQIMADTMWFWWPRALFQEGVKRLQTLLAVEHGERVRAPLEGERALQRARALRTLYWLTQVLPVLPNYREQVIEESVAILRRLGRLGRHELGIALLYHTDVTGQFSNHTPDLDEMLAIFEETNDRFYLSEYGHSKCLWYMQQMDYIKAKLCFEESLAISREIGDLDGISGRLAVLADLATSDGEYGRAEAMYRESLAISEQIHNRWWVYSNICSLRDLAMARGLYEEALAYQYQSQVLVKGIDRPGEESLLLFSEIAILWAMGDYPSARRVGEEILDKNSQDFGDLITLYIWQARVALAEGDLRQTRTCLINTRDERTNTLTPWHKCLFLQTDVWLFHQQGKDGLAVRLQAAIEDQYQHDLGWQPLREREEHDRCMAEMRAALGEEAFASAWQAGQALTLDQALGEAVTALE